MLRLRCQKSLQTHFSMTTCQVCIQVQPAFTANGIEHSKPKCKRKPGCGFSCTPSNVKQCTGKCARMQQHQESLCEMGCEVQSRHGPANSITMLSLHKLLRQIITETAAVRRSGHSAANLSSIAMLSNIANRQITLRECVPTLCVQVKQSQTPKQHLQ